MSPDTSPKQEDAKPTTTSTPNSPDTGVNPILAIAVAVAVALLLSGLSLIIFLRSDTRRAVQLIERSSDVSETDDLSEKPDEASPLTESDLNSIESVVRVSADRVNTEEFSSQEMTDGALGL